MKKSLLNRSFIKGSPNYNSLAAINDYTGEFYFLLHPFKFILLFIEKEEEEERQRKLAKEFKERLPRKMRKQKNVANKGRNRWKSMYVDCS
jgi:hypothetical protein